MENYVYTDIFATKGIEYLLIIFFLILLVIFLRWIMMPVAEKSGIKKLLVADWFHLAKDFYYHQGHSWIAPEESNIVKVGMDDFSQKLLGKVDSITLPDIGGKVHQGEKGWHMRVESKDIEMLAPVDGEVVEVNKAVIEDPGIINQDPYYNGWLFKVRVPKLTSGKKNLLTGKLAKAWMEQTVNKISMLITGNHEVVLQDGGTIVSGFIRELSPEEWVKTAKDFLLTADLDE